MKCCDVTKSWNRDTVNHFGPITPQHVHFFEPAGECCPDWENINSNACTLIDSHTTWELLQFSCLIQGIEIAFELTRTDIVIQEEMPSWMNYNPYSSYSTEELDVSRRVSVSRHVFECLGLAMPMSRLGLGP